jgi:FKBP-type peptidyl-prolyl cis-trans isomerase SlyD
MKGFLMKIAKNTVVTVKYSLSDAQGNLIEDGREPMVYLHGGYENTLPKIEEALDGKVTGFDISIQVEPDDAFGEYDPALVKVEPRDRLPTPLEVGMQFEGMPDGDADEEAMIFTVTDIADDKVVLDGNHPLAGMALRFTLNVLEVREASDEEIAHGHVHGGHGHHHGEEDDEDGEGDHFRSHPIH